MRLPTRRELMTGRIDWPAVLGDDIWGDGSGDAPGQGIVVRVDIEGTDDYHVFSFDPNSGYELWIGTKHEWKVVLPMPAARRLWWAITLRHLSTWFGLRRWLWVRALRANVQRHQHVMDTP